MILYTENGENIDTITLKIDNVYESLYAKTMYAENGFYETSDIRKKNVIDELPLDKAYELINNCQSIDIPITNYGICISELKGVLERILAPFPTALETYKRTKK